MKIFTCIDHDYFWPVGVASVIVANNEEYARELLVRQLESIGLESFKPFTLQELDITKEQALILQDGNY